MNSVETRKVIDMAVANLRDRIQVNPIGASVDLQITNLLMMAEIACHLADANAAKTAAPPMVTFHWKGDPVVLSPFDIASITIERHGKDPETKETLPAFVLIQCSNCTFAVNESLEEVCTALGLPVPELRKPDNLAEMPTPPNSPLQ